MTTGVSADGRHVVAGDCGCCVLGINSCLSQKSCFKLRNLFFVLEFIGCCPPQPTGGSAHRFFIKLFILDLPDSDAQITNYWKIPESTGWFSRTLPEQAWKTTVRLVTQPRRENNFDAITVHSFPYLSRKQGKLQLQSNYAIEK